MACGEKVETIGATSHQSSWCASAATVEPPAAVHVVECHALPDAGFRNDLRNVHCESPDPGRIVVVTGALWRPDLVYERHCMPLKLHGYFEQLEFVVFPL
jgi:hypothetical protein